MKAPGSSHRCVLITAAMLLSLNAHSAAISSNDATSAPREIQQGISGQDATLSQLADDATQLRAQGNSLQDRLSNLLAQAETSPSNRGVVQLLNQVEALNGELNRLRGQMEVLSNDISNAQKRQRDMYVDLDTRLRRIEQSAPKKDADTGAAAEQRKTEQTTAAPPPVTAAAVPPVSPTTTSAPAVAAPPSAPTGTAATPSSSLPPATLSATDQAAIQRAYDNAYSNYRLSDYPMAIRGFESFLKSYPRHALAPNSQYWIGDSYLRLRDNRSAIEAERRLLGTYPESPKSADALLIIGTAESNLGDAAAARKTFEELMSKYPSSESADKAKQRLAKLK
ncbi:MAG: tol-pal system protein YbgF [Betaproteobacteria bacterium]